MKKIENKDSKGFTGLYNFDGSSAKILMTATATYLSSTDIGNLRLVSTELTDFIENFEPITNRLCYHINGRSPHYKIFNDNDNNGSTNSVPIPVLKLIESNFHWAHLRFSNMDLETDFFSHPKLFDALIAKISLVSLKSLTLTNIFCGLGRLIELLTFCLKLEEIKIINCPSLFSTGVEIINWYQFIPHFLQRLNTLKGFTIIDRSRTQPKLNLRSIQGWMPHMKCLVTIDLRVSQGTLPIAYLITVIIKNIRTLRHLSLVGKFGLDSSTLTTLSKLNLQTLRFGSVVIIEQEEDGLFGKFLQNQLLLESLHLIQMKMDWKYLNGIQNLTKLTQVILEDCIITNPDIGTRAPLAKLSSLKDLRILRNLEIVSEFHWLPLFMGNNVTYSLSSLHLYLDKAFYMAIHLSESFSNNLKKLVISGVGQYSEIRTMSVTRMIQNILKLKKLKILEIKNSALTDDHFKSQISFGLHHFPTPSFQGMTNLKFLNLSDTQIGNDTLTVYITKIPNLEVLWINGTQVTTFGINNLGSQKKNNGTILKNLHTISARKCTNFWILSNSYKSFTEAMGIKVYCDIVDGTTQPMMYS